MVLDRLLTIVTDVANTLTSLFSSLIRFALSSPVNAAIVAASIAAIVFVGQFLVRRREKTEEKPVEAESSQEAVEASVIDQYTVDEVIRVKIMKMDGSAKYIVEEPALDERLAGIVANIEQAYVKKGVEPSTILKDLDLKDDELKAVTYHVIKDLKGSWKLEPLIRDEQLEDITVTKPGPAYVIHRRHPDLLWIETNIEFTAEELDKQVRLLAERNGAELSIAKPSAEVMTHDGDRIALTYAGELTPGASTITIRKFPRSPYTILDLIGNGTVNLITAAYIWTMLEAKKFVIVAGPTGSGKTTFLSAMLQLLPFNAKILTLEDYHPEINLSWHKNWHRFVTRRTLGETAYSLADILRLSLRHRPDYTVVGEVRGLEARVMFSAAATGHGMASTIHAEGLEDVYERLTSVSMGVLPEELSFLDIVVLIRGTPRGRRVIGVWEVEKVGKEHLISWYDQSLNRFFPENWRQLALNSPTLVNDAQLRRRYELNVAIIEKLLEQNGKMRAEELAKAVDQQRRAWEEVVAE
ncbi:MAG: type II/IV secretion system ATPase subunit [Candidatus Caldarchaeum sp.]|uniref:Bacterial type II secretion system protein E domain-containing protein n=1 Tax=Caldiarchaeum subterraneum TaxID=311458 RepID=A0A7C5LC01_CALS0